MPLNATLSAMVPAGAEPELLTSVHTISISEGTAMKKLVLYSTLLVSAFAFAGIAEAKGCIKGAIVGGIAGKMAGHGKVGAAAGCAMGHHRATKQSKG